MKDSENKGKRLTAEGRLKDARVKRSLHGHAECILNGWFKILVISTKQTNNLKYGILYHNYFIIEQNFETNTKNIFNTNIARNISMNSVITIKYNK